MLVTTNPEPTLWETILPPGYQDLPAELARADRPPVRGLLDRWLHERGYGDEAVRLLDELNTRLDDSDFAIGPPYFMRDEVHCPGGLERVWRTEILPLLEEHHYGEGVTVAERYGLERLRAGIRARAAGAQAANADSGTEPDGE